MKSKLIALVLLVLLLSGVGWLFNHSFVVIAVENNLNNSDLVSFQIIDQKNQKTRESKTNKTSLRKLVRKGNYEVLVSQQDKSYFQVVRAGGFLGSSKVQARLSSEKDRSFVGDNPSPCMLYSGGVLLSYGCGGAASDLSAHVPATPAQPTYKQKVGNNIDGTIEGIADTKDGGVILVRASRGKEVGGARSYTAHLAQKGATLSAGIPLPDLDKFKLYSIKSYKDGFVAYDSALDKILHYTSARAKPSQINIERPADSALKGYDLAVKGESIAVAYSNNTEGEVEDIHEAGSGKVKTEIIIYTPTKSKRFSFNKQLASMNLCGQEKLCTLVGRDLEVYDISGNKLKYRFKVTNVASVQNFDKSVVVSRDNEILGFNADSQNGIVHYSLGDYKFCGSQITNSQYILCVINVDNKKVALSIDPSQDNKDSIDKKVLQLVSKPLIDDVTIYGKYIFVTPELGEMVYNNQTRSFGFNPENKKAASVAIDQHIKSLDIDKNKYQINTGIK